MYDKAELVGRFGNGVEVSIPKILHFVWFSAEIPEKTQARIRNWKLLMPDYEVMHWNAESFDVESCDWVKEAVAGKMWAFATDYIRFWALQTFGGIYLDTDVQVLRPFDELLDRPYFIGMEQTKSIIEAAVLGAEPRCPWVDEILSQYNGRHFVKRDGTYDVTPLPRIIVDTLGKSRGFSLLINPGEFDASSPFIQLLPPEYFSPKRWDATVAHVTENSYCIHHFEGSWTKNEKGVRATFKKIKSRVMKIARAILGEERWQGWMFRRIAKGRK